MAYRHVVLFRVRAGVEHTQVDELVADLRALGSLPGVLSWRIEISLDTRKGAVVVEEATFTDSDAYERFRINPAHVAAAHRASLISDWWVGDYEA